MCIHVTLFGDCVDIHIYINVKIFCYDHGRNIFVCMFVNTYIQMRVLQELTRSLSILEKFLPTVSQSCKILCIYCGPHTHTHISQIDDVSTCISGSQNYPPE